tara:strand:- start:1570 stop:1797 length:228 start_codon:yes stop_codon:yes gene_type:complete
MKDSIIKQCLTILKKDEVKKEIVEIITPFTEPILEQLYPYIYISLIIVLISFLLHLGIFILLLRNKGGKPDIYFK